jgi:hypothetical protein
MAYGWLPILPDHDELLSSFLSRCARVHGMRPTVFCAFHLHPHAVWNRDVDRSASPALMKAIADNAHVQPQDIEAMTLRSWESVTHPVPLERIGSSGMAPWITAVGIYHRTRKRYGLQYCPRCLADHLVFYRTWRLAFVTVCPTHHLLLRDSCEACGAPIIPHRQRVSARYCDRCGRDLCAIDRGVASPSPSIRAALRLQEVLLGALTGQRLLVGQQWVEGAFYLQGARFLLAHLRLLDDEYHDHGCGQPRVPFESKRCLYRLALLTILERLLSDWPTNFITAATARGVTQRSFMGLQEPPEWIAQALLDLPPGRSYDRSWRPRRLRCELRSLHRNKPAGWRSLRAQVLLRGTRYRR